MESPVGKPGAFLFPARLQKLNKLREPISAL